jgi:DNA-binding NtrC family response regulator
MAAARVLVVDDERFVLDVTSRLLSKAGYEVACASNGREALEVVKAGPSPDLVISDCVIPGMQGPELLKSVREVSPSTAVILMSGYAPVETSSPPVPFLHKPFLPAELIATIERALSEARAARDESARTRDRSEQLRLEWRRVTQEAQNAACAAHEDAQARIERWNRSKGEGKTEANAAAGHNSPDSGTGQGRR